MPQAILPRISDNRYIEDDTNDEVRIQKYQMDSISLSSTQDDKETEEEEDDEEADEDFDTNNAIMVNDQPHLPHFGSVSVVNSNDVHFGNKTVYKGPVTIKQFVYPNGDAKSDLSNGYVNKIEIDGNVGGVLNGGFVGNAKDQECGTRFGDEKNGEIDQDGNNVAHRFRKGVNWIKTVPCKKPKETILFLFVLAISVTSLTAVIVWKNSEKVVPNDSYQQNDEEDIIAPIDHTLESDTSLGKLRIVKRLIWLAQPPLGHMNKLKLPVRLVIIQHTATIDCVSQAACIFQTRHIQAFAIESNQRKDICFNFLIGGDGAVYEGRGWDVEGTHTEGWNNVSIGVAFIGTFHTQVPSAIMLTTFEKLMEKGVELGYLAKDYKVMATRQFSAAEGPGKAFYDLIKTWPHWTDIKI